MARQPSAKAVQSTCRPLLLPSSSPSAITLERQSTTVPKTSKARILTELVMLLIRITLCLSVKTWCACLPAHRKLEGITVQRLTAARFNHDRCAQLQTGFEIFGDWIGLNDVNHIFLQRPRLQWMSSGFGAEFRRLTGFAVKDTVIGSEAVLFDYGRYRDDLFARSAGFADPANILVALKRSVEELSVNRRRLLAYGERAMDLRRVAPITHREFGDDDAAVFERA